MLQEMASVPILLDETSCADTSVQEHLLDRWIIRLKLMQVSVYFTGLILLEELANTLTKTFSRIIVTVDICAFFFVISRNLSEPKNRFSA